MSWLRYSYLNIMDIVFVLDRYEYNTILPEWIVEWLRQDLQSSCDSWYIRFLLSNLSKFWRYYHRAGSISSGTYLITLTYIGQCLLSSFLWSIEMKVNTIQTNNTTKQWQQSSNEKGYLPGLCVLLYDGTWLTLFI